MQRNRITALWRQATLILAVSAALVVPAQAAPAPDEVVRNAVERMTQRIDNERERLKEDAAYARRVINEELDALVDFRRVTRLVMGDHFQNASAEQRREFMRRFRTSLVQTFSTGITLYEGQPIRVLPLEEGDVRDNRARVQMEFGTESGRPMPIAYTMFLDGEQWKVDNLIVNGLNMGRVYRMQFDQAMRQHQGDIDKVIQGWTVALDPEEFNLDGG